MRNYLCYHNNMSNKDTNKENTSQQKAFLGELEEVDDIDSSSINQVEKVKTTNNPDGVGGFGDNPENRSNGRWRKEDSFSYNMNKFKSMTVAEFEAWKKTHPKKERTVAQQLAFTRVFNADKDLKEFQEVANRTEGKAQESIDHTTNGESMNFSEVNINIIDGSKEKE